MNLTLKNGTLIDPNGKIIDLKNYYTEDYFNFLNAQAQRFNPKKTFFVNDLYLFFFVRQSAIYEYVFSNLKIRNLIIENDNQASKIIIDAATKVGVRIIFEKQKLMNYNLLYSVFNFILFTYYLFSVTTFALISVLKSNNRTVKTFAKLEYSLIHSKTSFKIIRKFIQNQAKTNDHVFLYDPLSVSIPISLKRVSIYDYFKKTDIYDVISRLIINSYKEYFILRKQINDHLGNESVDQRIRFFFKRIPYLYFQKEALERVFYQMEAKQFYSGEKESRWGLIENQLAIKYGKYAICIPHGLEYGMKFPGGVFGNLLYATSEEAKKIMEVNYPHLEVSYNDSFLRDVFVLQKSCKETKECEKIVFFTEGRNHKRDEYLINEIVNSGLSIYVKFHPQDRLSNYNFLHLDRITILESFDVAISNNICLARSSTVLLEAIYNDSISISLLIHNEDKFNCNYLYPSLNNRNINKFYAIDEAIYFLKNVSQPDID